MYCSKCKFNSFDHLPKCPKCGFEWNEARDALQLGWLQSAGYDWFEHAQPQRVRNEDFVSSTKEASGFAFSLDASATLSQSQPDIFASAPDQPLLIDAVTFAALPDELDAAAAEAAVKAASGDQQPRAEVFTEEYEIQLELDDILPAPLHAEASASKSAPASGQLPTPENASSEDVLTTWEIPDDMLPKGLDANPLQTDESQAQSDVQAGIETHEPIPAAEIDYDFSAVETETPTPKDADATKPSSKKTPGGPDQTRSSGQGNHQ